MVLYGRMSRALAIFLSIFAGIDYPIYLILKSGKYSHAAALIHMENDKTY